MPLVAVCNISGLRIHMQSMSKWESQVESRLFYHVHARLHLGPLILKPTTTTYGADYFHPDRVTYVPLADKCAISMDNEGNDKRTVLGVCGQIGYVAVD